jgi:hypothetical protein
MLEEYLGLLPFCLSGEHCRLRKSDEDEKPSLKVQVIGAL